MKISHDVVIAGAGPAGSLAALVLARAGHQVALLDRAAFPRVKVCGNCLNPIAWDIWRKLGLTSAFEALPHRELTGFTVNSEGREVFSLDFTPPHRGPRGIARDVLDDWLRREAEAAGAMFFPETTVTAFDSSSGRIETSRGTFTARLVLGADGRNSLVARQARLMPPPRRCLRVAWQVSIPAPASLDDRVHMHLFEEGYFGFCRYDAAHAVISMVLDSRRSQEPLALVQRVLPDLRAGGWLRMNPITRAPARLGTERVWLLGDAARVVEPFTGEGISFALTTGLLAAEAAKEGLARNDLVPAFIRYRREHGRLYRRRAWVNTLVRWSLTTPRRTVTLLRRVDRLPGFVSVLARKVHSG